MPRARFHSRQTLEILSMLRDAAPQWRHGYALMQATGLKSGTLYPAMMRLADEGLLEARWDADGDHGRPRKLYRLTARGLQFAEQQHSRRSQAIGAEAFGKAAGA